MTTKKKTKGKAGSRRLSRLLLQESGSPILIGGGGSMSLYFDHVNYPPTTAGADPSDYQDPSGKEEIGAVLVMNKHGGLQGSELVPTGATCEVTITNGNSRELKLSSSAAAGLVIHFDDPASFRFDNTRGVHRHSSGKLTSVRVLVNGVQGINLITNDPPSNPKVVVVVLDRKR